MGFTDKDKVIILQPSPGDVAEMGHAVLNHMLTANAPFVAYKGIYIKQAAELDMADPTIAAYELDGGSVVRKDLLP
eukprot:11403576-Alexandrium_andersonii.AAC.1